MIDFIFNILPLVVVSIAMVIFINNVKKKNEENKAYKDTNEGSKKENYMTMGMSLGIAIGSSFVNIFGTESISYGICFGMLCGMIIGMNIEKK